MDNGSNAMFFNPYLQINTSKGNLLARESIKRNFIPDFPDMKDSAEDNY